jgi:hypothetical protein
VVLIEEVDSHSAVCLIIQLSLACQEMCRCYESRSLSHVHTSPSLDPILVQLNKISLEKKNLFKFEVVCCNL